jgi:alpha-N-acetylglucosamine transferase
MNSLLTGKKQKRDKLDLQDVLKVIIFRLTEHDSAGLFDADPISIGNFDETFMIFNKDFTL